MSIKSIVVKTKNNSQKTIRKTKEKRRIKDKREKGSQKREL
jgi:hypothetical protein